MEGRRCVTIVYCKLRHFDVVGPIQQYSWVTIYAGDGGYNGHAGGRCTADNVGYDIGIVIIHSVPVGITKEPG